MLTVTVKICLSQDAWAIYGGMQRTTQQAFFLYQTPGHQEGFLVTGLVPFVHILRKKQKNPTWKKVRDFSSSSSAVTTWQRGHGNWWKQVLKDLIWNGNHGSTFSHISSVWHIIHQRPLARYARFTDIIHQGHRYHMLATGTRYQPHWHHTSVSLTSCTSPTDIIHQSHWHCAPVPLTSYTSLTDIIHQSHWHHTPASLTLCPSPTDTIHWGHWKHTLEPLTVRSQTVGTKSYPMPSTS